VSFRFLSGPSWSAADCYGKAALKGSLFALNEESNINKNNLNGYAMTNNVSPPVATARSITNHVPTQTTPFRSRYVRYFFVGMASLFPLLVVIGFLPDYQGMLSGNLKAHWFSHFHGAVMTAWLGMFLTQSLLAARGNLKFHRKLGLISVWLGVFVWLTLGITTFRALIGNNPPMADGQFDILLIALYGMTLFGLFFAWGMRVRKNAAAHKRLLLLATLVTMQAAIDRMPFLPGIATVLFPRFLYLDALLLPLLLYDWLTLQRIHKITWLGALFIGVLQVGIVVGWESPAWHRFWFNGISPFVEKVVEVKLNNVQAELLVGDYGDKKWHMTVSREGGKLYLKLPDQPKWELGATAATKLFVRTINWKLIFVKGADGQVTKVINDQINIVWEAQRLK
jgi:hypothetical protein